jgi:ABC-type nickel/cobalt efflux system permease component RcnA
VHEHRDGVRHAHAHAHDPAVSGSDAHHHRHATRSHVSAALVGTVHGMAGSAALVVLTSATSASFWIGLAYIACFGVGSIIGMALLSFAISWPLEISSRRLARAYGLIELPIALATMGLGLWMVQ